MEELKQLGRYQLTRVLGRGAMGVVYEAIDPKLNRQIAVKTILKGHISDKELEAEYSARFIREAQAVARLNHPNIVTVFDFGEENDIAFIVMECIRGDELKTYFDEKRQFTLDEAVRMTSELLDALDYAHENGIVHRDIKPANVMLDGQSRVKLTDFGVARLSDASAERTQAGTMVGTPSYMSPEQIEGSAVGPRSDIFAVGIILYQFLTGEKPFHAAGMWAIQKKIMQEDPVLPSIVNPEIPAVFDAVVLRALAKKPDDRYGTAREFKQDLQRALAGEELADMDATMMVSRPRLSSNTIQQPGEGSQAGRSTGPGTGTGSGLRTGATNASRPPITEATGTAGLEIEFWRSIKDSNDPEEIEAYMKRFPGGVYTELAQRKLARLRGEGTSATGSLKPPFAQATGEEDATLLAGTGTGSGTGTGTGTRTAQTNTTTPSAPTRNEAAPKAGNKLLFPGIAAGVLVLAGVAYMMSNGGGNSGTPSEALPSPAPSAAPSTLPSTPPQASPTAEASPNPAPSPAADAQAEAARLEEERKAAARKEAEKAEQERIERQKAEANAKTPEEKKRLLEEEKKKAEERAAEKARKAEEEAARKKAQEDKKKQEEEARKKAQEEASKKAAEENAKKAAEEAARKKAQEEAAKKPEAAPSPSAAPSAAMSPSALRAEAAALEGQGKMREAVKLYKQAANAGSGEAAKRLGNIYGKGEGGIPRDYAESTRWNNRARALGMDIPTDGKL